GKQRGDVGEKLARNVFRGRSHFAKRRIVFVQKFVIKAIVDDLARAFFNFADVDEHSRDRIDLAAKNKIGGIISTRPVLCPCLRTKRDQVFAVGPAGKEQPPRGRELKPFADRQKHEVENTSGVIVQDPVGDAASVPLGSELLPLQQKRSGERVAPILLTTTEIPSVSARLP